MEDSSKKGRATITLAPESYSYEMMSQVLAAEAKGSWAKHGAYGVAWKYLIYMEVFKKLAAGGSFKTGASAKIYNYVRDQVRDFDRNPIGLLVSYLKRLEGVKIGKYEASIKARELDRLYRLEEIADLVKLLDQVTERQPIVILVDELDKGWDSSEDAKAFISGLFTAATAINTAHANITVLISLRKELYVNIPQIYDDYQKISDTVENLAWEEGSLLEFVARRIKKCFPELESYAFADTWNKIFAEKLSYRNAASFNYVLDRTLFRPRELIQFLNEIADEARAHGRGLPLDYDSIVGAEGRYSQARLADISSEYRHQYPGLGNLFETFRGLQYNMQKSDFHEHLLRVACGEYQLHEAKSWVADQDAEYLIKVLWEVGFIKAQVVGGVKAQRRSGSEWLGSYQITGINVNNMPQYQVHPMFRSFLGMKERKAKS